MKSETMKPNHLINERSPYLLQHLYNPVDWYPWGEEAFRKAGDEGKPIFLSIGYSTCHWCHVMAHESFDDPEVARLLNEAFVSIKVDREERPDIDGVYMDICQMMTGRGGWPLTIVMTPDKRPFFAATYIPRDSRAGQPGMLAILPKLRELWVLNRSEALMLSRRVTDALRASTASAQGYELPGSLLDTAYEDFSRRFDAEHGGFGNAPKFPSAHQLMFLLRNYRRTGEEKALRMVEKTLGAMRLGGIYDHIGYGFHRYSTDSSWLLPHFEKMLYDQAMLSILYTEAWQATGKEDYRKTAEEIMSYVLRDMTSPEGGFFSAEDADSEGEEGKFYHWEKKEIEDLLDQKEAGLIIRLFNVKEEGNYFDEAGGHKTGKNILHLKKSVKELAMDEGLEDAELQNLLAGIRSKLFTHRENRVHPLKDDKILTDWNGLFIAALAKAAMSFEEPRYQEAAEKAVKFILDKMRTPGGALLHRYRDGKAGIPAQLSDYASMIWGLLELYEATFKVEYLASALEFQNEIFEHFQDEKYGGFFSTAEYGEELLIRKREIYDGAIPSGNSVAMMNLLRLSRYTGDMSLQEKALELGAAFAEAVSKLPSAFAYLMVALDFAEGPSYEIVVAGNPENADTRDIVKTLRALFLPNKVLILRPTNEQMPEIIKVAPYTESYRGKEGKAIAYICSNLACKAPISDIGELKLFFQVGEKARR